MPKKAKKGGFSPFLLSFFISFCETAERLPNEWITDGKRMIIECSTVVEKILIFSLYFIEKFISCKRKSTSDVACQKCFCVALATSTRKAALHITERLWYNFTVGRRVLPVVSSRFCHRRREGCVYDDLWEYHGCDRDPEPAYRSVQYRSWIKANRRSAGSWSAVLCF